MWRPLAKDSPHVSSALENSSRKRWAAGGIFEIRSRDKVCNPGLCSCIPDIISGWNWGREEILVHRVLALEVIFASGGGVGGPSFGSWSYNTASFRKSRIRTIMTLRTAEPTRAQLRNRHNLSKIPRNGGI